MILQILQDRSCNPFYYLRKSKNKIKENKNNELEILLNSPSLEETL